MILVGPFGLVTTLGPCCGWPFRCPSKPYCPEPFRFPAPLSWKTITHAVLAAGETREGSSSSPSPGSLISSRASRSRPRWGETGRGNRAAAAGRERGREGGRAGRPAPGAQPASPGYVTRAQNKVRKVVSAFPRSRFQPGERGGGGRWVEPA